jgi:hypothetical protein
MRTALFSLVALVACRGAEGNGEQPQPTPKQGIANELGKAKPIVIGDPAVKETKDLVKGDHKDEDWVPAEFKAGAARWKDVGVYVDGKPISFMTFGELPITLKPVWIKKKADAPIRPNSGDPGWRWKDERFYRFTDYLKSLGIDVRKVKELHVYGPKITDSIVVSNKELLSPKANDFLFRFGGELTGKPIPRVPPDFANGKAPDKLTSMMVYIDKKPPTIDREEGFILDGAPVEGVPYYGEPLRGGVRIYLDDHLATIIKRQELDAKAATKTPDGELHWSLAEFLAKRGVDTKNVVELWVIRNDRRKEKLAGSEIAKLTFAASSQAKGGVALGDNKLLTNAIAMHTRPVKDEELPQPTPDEAW